MNVDPKVQKIKAWKESFTVLPDAQFFDLIHVYLGEIKTPYNKQKLIEEVSAFLRKDENKQNIIKLLTPMDIKILCAIKFINQCNNSKLENFFAGELSFSKLLEYLISLTERLLIFTYEDVNSGKKIIDINPNLDSDLEKYLTLNNLICGSPKDFNSEISKIVSSDYIAAFVSYISMHSDMCKASGDFKKKTVNELSEIFGSSDIEKLQLIFNGLRNLNILIEKDEGTFLDWNRLSVFSDIDEKNQLIYLCAAGDGHFSRSTIQKNAQLFFDTLNLMGETAYSKNSIAQLSNLIKEKSGGNESFSGSRFSEILSRSNANSANDSMYGSIAVVCSMIENAYEFGILQITEEEKYFVSDSYKNLSVAGGIKKVLSLDSAFSISVMPGLKLKEYIELLKILNIVHYDTVSSYELTKKSIMNAFDSGYKVETVLETLAKYSLYEVPQSIKVSVEEWSLSYNSANLYKGFVLKTSAENSELVQKNPVLKTYIYEILAPGIFMLNFSSDEEAKAVIEKSGLEFIGGIKTSEEKSAPAGFRTLFPSRISFGNLNSFTEEISIDEKSAEASSKEVIKELEEELSKMEMTAVQRDGLLTRIRRKIIVNKNQLRPESVRFEVNEVFGMDFNAKVILIENAIQNQCMMEIEFGSGRETVLVKPLNFNRKTGLLLCSTEPDHEHEDIKISYAVRMKKIKNAFYL